MDDRGGLIYGLEEDKIEVCSREDDGLGFPLIPVILGAIGLAPLVISLFKKKPALTTEQLNLLATLPLEYQKRAVQELEASKNQKAMFDTIFQKYYNLANKDAKKQSGSSMKWIYIGGGVLITALLTILILKKRR